MENNENNAQNQEQKKTKKVFTPLIIIMLIVALAIGIGGGYLLSKNDLFNKNETKSNNANNDNKNENKVISVVTVEDGNEMVRKQMTIEGRDKDNNTVWSYTTLEENIPQEVINRGLKIIETRKGKVYLCDWGKLYILDEQTGKVLAQNTEHNIGGAAVYIFDENDNLYTTSYLAAVDKFDTNAQLLKTTESKIWDKGFYWPKKMTLNGDNLIIDYGDEGSVTVNKETLEIIDAKNNIDLNNNTSATISNYAEEYIKIIDKVCTENSNNDIKFDLIYFNNDNIPDLVIDNSAISLYMYENGNVYTLMNNESYGIGGSKYFDYIERKGVVYNYGNSYAGAISHDTYFILNSEHKFDKLSYTRKEEGVIRDNPQIPEETLNEIQKDIEKYGGYFYNDKKISEQEFNNKLNELSISSNQKDHKSLSGSKSVEEIKKLLK